MARVLLAWELGGGIGHCAKLASIARGLIEEGHETFIAARDLVTARQVLASTPVVYFQAPYLARASSSAPARSLVDILVNTGFGDETSLDVLCSAWRSLFDAAKPDMLICDHAPMALLASRWHSMRRVVVGTGFTVPPLSRFPDLRYWLPATSQAVDDQRQVEETVLWRMNRLLRRDQLPPLERFVDLYTEVDQRFLMTFRELDHYPQREGDEYWGTWPLEGGSTCEWPPGRPRLFAYLKPPTADWRPDRLLAFLRKSQLASVIYIPGANPAWLKEYQTTWTRFIDRPVNLTHAAHQCDVAILHGTAGSVTALLLGGIPQLNIPLYLEQLILSRRVADLGAGLFANPTRVDQITDRLITLLHDGRYRDNAKRFSQRHATFDAANSRVRVVSAIRELLTYLKSA